MRTDAELLRLARTDPAAFRELYDRYAERVHRYHLRRSRNAEAAHDLTAETFAQAWRFRARFRDDAGGSAGPWLFGISRNVVRVSVRKRRLERDACERLGVFERLDRAPAAVEPDETWLEGLDDALSELPATQRQALELRVVDDLDYNGVAATLETTPAAARVRVHRALTALRERIDSREAPR
jgi:RNA polymerase sigma-70 factor (ECF subfamily)